MEKITDEIVARVKAANPGTDLHQIEHDKLPEYAIIRAPSKGEWDIYVTTRDGDAETGTKSKPIDAMEMLVSTCVLFPLKDELERQISRAPALREAWVAEIVEIAGITRGTKRKKL